MTPASLKYLTITRISESEVLYKSRLYSGSYYLAGYAVECAIKVVIAKTFKHNEIPDKAFVNSIYTHDLKRLLQVAQLDGLLNRNFTTNTLLFTNWSTVTLWSEQARYEKFTKNQAKELRDSILDAQNGVLQWIQQHW